MKPTRIWRFEGENLILQVTDLGSLRDQGARIAQDIQAAGLKDAITSKWKLEKNHEIAKYPMFTALFEQPRASAPMREKMPTRGMWESPSTSPTRGIPWDM